MPKSYLVSWRLPTTHVVSEPIRPIGTMVDRHEQPLDFPDALPYIEVVAKRFYHKMQSQMDEPITLSGSFHKFVQANEAERKVYGNLLKGFFPIIHDDERLGKGGDRVTPLESYLVFELEDTIELP